jgi:regulator of protease activity HflC (stomatin/prohibitin superfamily)
VGLIVLGLIILAVGIIAGRSAGPLTKFKSLFLGGGILVIIIGLVLASVRIINPGHVGVQVLFGKVQDEVLYEGLNLVNPLIQIEEFSIRTQNYTMSSTFEEGQQSGNDAINILSNDGLEVNIDLTILYKVNPIKAPQIYRTLGPNFEKVIIRPVTRTGIRNSASRYDAVELFAEKRDEFENSIRDAIQDTFQMRGFYLDQILVRKIDLPESVKQSIERKITAVQEAQRMEFVLQKEDSEAERKRVEARGIADAQKIVNEGLTPKLLEFERIKMQKELAKSNNSKIIIMGSGDAPPIFMNSK